MSFDKCLKQETLFSSKLWSLLRVDQAQKTIAKQQEYSMALDLVLTFFYAVTQTLTLHNQLFKFIQTVNCTNVMTALYVTFVFQVPGDYLLFLNATESHALSSRCHKSDNVYSKF